MNKVKEIAFECPRCGSTAFAFSRTIAGCTICGSLLYTEIPNEIKKQFPKLFKVDKFYLTNDDEEIKNCGAV